LIVSVNTPEPATTVVGLIEVTVGEGDTGGAGVAVLELGLDDDPPPQPIRNADAVRQKSAVSLVMFCMTGNNTVKCMQW
jgi:hypothetical protein